MYSVDNCMIAWRPGDNASVEVGPWPGGWSRGRMAVGACFAARHDMTPRERVGMLFIDFHTLVVRDGIDPLVAHREFLKIKEYREHMSPDIEGAE